MLLYDETFINTKQLNEQYKFVALFNFNFAGKILRLST